MRGYVMPQPQLFVQVHLEDLIPAEHPLRWLKPRVDEILECMSGAFDTIYSAYGRPSIPPEQLLKGELLRILYTIRSERQLEEQIRYNLLFRWFLDLEINDSVWDASTYSHNRDRLMDGDIADLFFEKVLAVAEEENLLSSEHFTVDGTLLEACAGLKSLKPRDGSAKPPEDNDPGNPTIDFKGEKRCNQTHQSTSDPEARLYRKGKGKEAKLSYMGHVVIENRNGLAVNTRVTTTTGTAEREAAQTMMAQIKQGTAKPVTMGADKNYDTVEHVKTLRALGVTPHVSQKKYSAIDGRTTRHSGYSVSQKKRKRVEEVFGWGKTIGGLRKLRHRGVELVNWIFTFTLAAYNLVRMKNLLSA